MRNALFTALGIIFIITALALWATPIVGEVQTWEYLTIKVGFPFLALAAGFACIARERFVKVMTT